MEPSGSVTAAGEGYILAAGRVGSTLIFGILVLATGFSVMSGNTAARLIGIVLAVLCAIVNLAFLAVYPIWSTIVITLDVLVIYALAVSVIGSPPGGRVVVDTCRRT